MTARRWLLAALLLCVAFYPLGVSAAPVDVEPLLKVMPADAAMSAVIVNMEKFDKSLGAAVRTISPDAHYGGMLNDIKDDLPIAAWIDFTKPVGMTQANIAGGGEPVLWASVADFAVKVKTVAEAKEENGVWNIPFEGTTVYAKAKGAYVAAATDANTLNAALREGKTLAEELKTQAEFFKDRDALIHINFDPIRPMAQMGLMQASQMAPMLGMMAASSGGDPAGLTAAVVALIDAAKSFVEQVAYLDIAIGVGEATGTITLATGFKEGTIKSYLSRQKPASVPLLADLPEQPYLAAVGFHVPGTESPFYDYLFEQMSAAMAAPGAPGAAPADPAKAEAAKAAFQVSRDLYRKVEGSNALFAFTSNGMRASGDYIGADSPGILELTKKSITTANPVMKNFSGGATYETLPAIKIGDVSVDQFAIKFDTSNPTAAQAAQMMGENTRFYVGIAGGKVRYCMGIEEDAKRVFGAKVEKPLIANKQVVDAIAALPAKRNAIVLLEPSGILPLMGQMMGAPKAEPMPPGAPIAISLTLSAEPARVDIHVPFQSIARMVAAMKPQPPA